MRHKCSSKLCLLFGPFGPTSLQQKAAAKGSQLWDSHQLAGLKMVLSRDHVVQKRWSCEVVCSDQLCQGDPGLCWGSSALMIVDLTFHEQWHICQVRRWPSCRGSLAWLGSHPTHSLATRKDATVEVALPMRDKCSSKPCLLFGPFGPTSLQQKAAAKGSQLGDSHQLAGLKMVLSRDHVVQKRWSCEVVCSDQLCQGDPGLCWGSSALMIVDLTFHEQWHICQVRCWPSCCGSLAWLGSHPSHSLATRKDVEVALPMRHKCSSKLCLFFGHLSPHLYSKVRITTWGQPSASRV